MKLNLIKKFGEGRGGGVGRGGGSGGGAGTETKIVCQMQLSTQCRACGTINISKYIKYINIFLSTNPTTFILSSLVSEF